MLYKSFWIYSSATSLHEDDSLLFYKHQVIKFDPLAHFLPPLISKTFLFQASINKCFIIFVTLRFWLKQQTGQDVFIQLKSEIKLHICDIS